MAKAGSARNRRRVIEGWASVAYRASTGQSTSCLPSALWTLPGSKAHRFWPPNWLNTNSGCGHFDWKCPFQADPSWSPCTGLSELSMSRVMTFGGRRSLTASIQRPDKSISAARFSGRLCISVSNRPMALAEAALLFTACAPTRWRITGSWHSRSASLMSWYPARREKIDCRRRPAKPWRAFRPVRGSPIRPAAMSVRPRASSSSR